MRRSFGVFILLIATMSLFAPVTSAQVVASADCTANADSTSAPPTAITGDFFEGEILVFAVSGPGQFSVTVNGTLLLDGAVDGDSTSYILRLDEAVVADITVLNGTPNSMVNVTCTPPDEAPDDSDGTICHIPPGNPDAAHTITVGSENAVETHLSKHGDTLGGCPEGVETRVELPDINITIFIIFASDSIEIFGECTDVCEEVISTPIILIIDLELVILDGVFMPVENPEDFGFVLDEVSTDGVSIIIYYLHPDPDDATTGVFQINIYRDGELLDDSILIFINTDGEITRWTDQSVWDEEGDS